MNAGPLVVIAGGVVVMLVLVGLLVVLFGREKD